MFDTDEKFVDWVEEYIEDDSSTLRVSNSENVDVVLLPLDNKIISGHSITKGGVADCALLTEKMICFVEFKTNVESNNSQTLHGRIEEAKKQLWHTYNDIVSPKCSALKIVVSD